MIRGRVAALLDLGTGFHPELTGRENIFISAVIAGLTRHQVAQRLNSIVAFAELERVIDNPLRTYSSGMQLRLAFAVGIHTTPDVLLIDEVLAVGDHSHRVRRFVDDHENALASRVRREVRNKLTTGLKNPRRRPARRSR